MFVLSDAFDSWACRSAYQIGIAPTVPCNGGTRPGMTADGPIPLSVNQAVAETGEQAWRAVASINSEVTQMRALWLSPTSRLNYAIEFQRCGHIGTLGYNTSNTPLRTMLKSHPESGDVYLFAVNVDNAGLTMRVSLSSDSLLLPTRLSTCFESGRSVPVNVSTNSFEDNFVPFDVHVYCLPVHPVGRCLQGCLEA